MYLIRILLSCTIVAGLLGALLLVVKPLYDYFQDKNGLRRFPSAHPLAGITNLWYMYVTYTHKRYLEVHQQHQQHSIIRVGPNHLSFSDPDAIKEIHGHGTFNQKSDWYAVQAGSHRHLSDVQDRDEHSRKRKMMATAYSQKAVVGYEPFVMEKIEQLIKAFDNACSLPLKDGESPNDADLIDYRFWTNLLTFEIIAKIGASQDLGFLENGTDAIAVKSSDGKQYNTHVITALHEGIKISVTMAWASAWFNINRYLTRMHPGWHHGQAFGDFVTHVVNKRLDMDKEGFRASDFTGALLYDRDGQARNTDYGEIHAEIAGETSPSAQDSKANARIVMMNAGSDTTAIALTNFLYEVAKRPAILDKLRAEIDAALIDPDIHEPVVPYEKARSLPYLRACIEESLRLYPPTGMGFPRVTPPEGATISGQYIPGGVTISIPAYSSHRDPKIWSDPDEFMPERWLGEDASVLMSRYYITFSFGSRGCIGRNISYLEQTMFLATFLSRYEFALESPDWEIERVEGLSLWPEALPIKLWRRNTSPSAQEA